MGGFATVFLGAIDAITNGGPQSYALLIGGLLVLVDEFFSIPFSLQRYFIASFAIAFIFWFVRFAPYKIYFNLSLDNEVLDNPTQAPIMLSSELSLKRMLTVPSAIPETTITPEDISAYYFEVGESQDGFVPVYQDSNSQSPEVVRLVAPSRILCSDSVEGENINGFDEWLYCPLYGGYIFRHKLKSTQISATDPTLVCGKATVTTNLYVRVAPDRTKDDRGYVMKDKQVDLLCLSEVYSDDRFWRYVRTPEHEGWMSKRFLLISENNNR